MKNQKRTVIIIGGNSAKNIGWVDKTAAAYSDTYEVIPIYFQHWRDKGSEINFNLELERLARITSQLDEYIVIAKSAGALLSLMSIRDKILKPTLLVIMGVPLDYASHRGINVRNLCKVAQSECRLLVIQQFNDPQGTANLVRKELHPSTPLIEINGSDHVYSRIYYIKKIISIYAEIDKESLPNDIRMNSLKRAVEKADANRHLYRYNNCWLSDPSIRLLTFIYFDKIYIIKRTLESKARVEIKNAELLKMRLSNLKIRNYQIEISTPSFISTGKRKGYLISEYLGKDLNQSYYYKDIAYPGIHSVITELYSIMLKKGFVYNGLLPRNTVIKNNAIYLIDFEDVNNREKIAAEANFKIAWSYFISSLGPIKEQPATGDEYAALFHRIVGKLYQENPYEIARHAESAGGRHKMDDIICAISPHISDEIEVILDTLLYIEKRNRVSFNISGHLAGLFEEIRILSRINQRLDTSIKKHIHRRLSGIFNTIAISGKTPKDLALVLDRTCLGLNPMSTQ